MHAFENSTVLSTTKKPICCAVENFFTLLISFLSLVLAAMKDHNSDPYVVGKAIQTVASLSATGQLGLHVTLSHQTFVFNNTYLKFLLHNGI